MCYNRFLNVYKSPRDEQHRRDDLIYLFGVQMYGTDDDRHTKLIRLKMFEPPHLVISGNDTLQELRNRF